MQRDKVISKNSIDQNLRAGLIGCGRIGSYTSEKLKKSLPKGWLPLNHADAIISVKGLSLDALCDINEFTLSEAGNRLQINKRFTSYKELISEVKPDVLSVATRTKSRCEIIDFAVKQGVKAIHIEKPISTSLKECIVTLDEAEKNKVKISYGTYRRYMGAYRKTREIVSSGELGEIIEIHVQHGKTYLLWSHPHSADLLNFFSGGAEIESIQATCSFEKDSVSKNIIDCDPAIQCAFVNFSNGINGVISCASGMNTQITCTKGTITVIGDGSEIKIKKTGDSYPMLLKEEDVLFSYSKSGTQTAFEELIQALKSDGLPGISLNEILQSQKILFGAVASSLNKGKRVKPNEINPELTVTGRIGELFA